jgi:hypothetical protein
MIGQALTNLAAGQTDMLLQLPGGCGEQNMVRIAPNVYVLHYLTKTKQMIADMENKKNNYIQKGKNFKLDNRESIENRTSE